MNQLLVTDKDQLTTMWNQIKIFVNSGFLPDHIKTPQQAFTISQMGRELRVPPLTAFNSIYMVNGKPSLKAEMMLALIRRDYPNSIINFLELTNDVCTIEVQKDDKHKPTKISFTWEDAQRAELDKMWSRKDQCMVDNINWKKYPRAMLRSRCISEMARTIFPDVLHGMSYTPEELGAVIDLDGGVQAPTPDVEKSNVETKVNNQPKPRDVKEESESVSQQQEEVDELDKALGPEETPQQEVDYENESQEVSQGDSGEHKPFGALEKLEQARKDLKEGRSSTQTNDQPEPPTDEPEALGDFVYRRGSDKYTHFGKKIGTIPIKDLYKIKGFMYSLIENGKAEDPDRLAHFMIGKFLEEEKQNNR